MGYEGTWREDAVKQRLVPIFSDWVVGFAVDEEGQVLCSDAEDSREYRPITNARQRHIVLAQAATRFPELVPLRPQRRPEDPICPSCKGAGGVSQYPDLICACGNLGWIPAGSVLEPS